MLLPLAFFACFATIKSQQVAPPSQYDSRQFFYGSNGPQNGLQYLPQLGYDFGYQSQYQPPFFGNRQPYPRLQPQPNPQVLYYNGINSGQPFLIQPGGAPPPHNFLGNPNVLRSDPQTPLFTAGFPRPAHIPPVERDAEEIPTNPSQIAPLPSTASPSRDKAPEKLETFEEDNRPKTAARPPSRTNLQPGQQFFILNGQSLYAAYPFNNQINPAQFPNLNLRYGPPPLEAAFRPSNSKKDAPTNIEGLFVRNDVTGQIDDITPGLAPTPGDSLIVLNQDGGLQGLFRSVADTKDVKLDGKGELGANYELLQVNDGGANDEDNEAVVIDARYQDEVATTPQSEAESEVVNAEKSNEPTIAQAAPGAIALAGPGGVAAAAPRGTAFVGKDGVAVSSPQATAVAGPKKEDKEEQKTKKPKRKQ